MLPDIYSTEDVAGHLGVSAGYLENEARKHGCCAEVGTPSRLVYTPQNVSDLLDRWRVRNPEGEQHLALSAARRTRRPYTPEMLAKEWSCSANHIRNLIRSGSLRHFRMGTLYRIPYDAIEEFTNSGGVAEDVEDVAP